MNDMVDSHELADLHVDVFAKGESRQNHSKPAYHSGDRNDLAKLGKREVLTRRFGFLSILGFTCTILITWEGELEQFDIGFHNGGPAGLVYGFILVWIGTMATFATLAELASMAPTSGGQYHWVSMLAPPSVHRFLSYMTGWLTVVGWQASTAGLGYISGTIIQGLIKLNHPEYAIERWQSTLLFWACTLFAVSINTVVGQVLPAIERVILMLHIFGFFLILIPMVYLGPHSSSAEVFKSFVNGGGWETDGLSFFVGLSGHIFSLAGADGAIHMCEEIRDASRVVPRSILLSLTLNGILGFAIVIAVLFCLGDITAATDTPTGYPFIEVFLQATDSVNLTTFMSAIILLMGISSQIALLAAASRMMWAFARDRGLPGWWILNKVEPRTTIPIPAVLTSTAISFLLALICIGSSAVLNDVISIAVGGFYSSYLVACSLLLWRRCTGAIRLRADGPSELSNTNGVSQLVWGPWRLGKTFGIVNNALACIYLAVTLFFTFWPPDRHPTAESMNYAITTTGGVILLSVLYYTLWAHKSYSGPLVEVLLRH